MLTFLPLLTLLQTSPSPSFLNYHPVETPRISAPIVSGSKLPTPRDSSTETGVIVDKNQISQRPSYPGGRRVVRNQDVRPLPGTLDSVPVFNSNSPEVIQQNGIVVSTFPPDDMAEPSAHLNYAFDGRFDVFAHHVARGLDENDVRTMYTGIILHNPGTSSVIINISQAASYLSQEAPFLNLPPYVANPLGDVFSGPGSRVMGEMLRGLSQSHWPTTITIPPQRSRLLVNLPIPLRRLTVPVNGTLPPGRILLPPLPEIESPDTLLSLKGVFPGSFSPIRVPSSINPLAIGQRKSNYVAQSLPTNGRTTLMRLFSSGPVHLASLAMHAPLTNDNHERVPTLSEWEDLLAEEGLSGPRDYPPTPPEAQQFSRFFYGRVAGVAKGSQWMATLTDNSRSGSLTIPAKGGHVSYALSTLDHNTFGTGQIQSAPMVTRYPDTAYRAHGNYGIHYNLSLPLHNDTDQSQKVAIKFETPIQDENQRDRLTFLNPPDDRIFFRGTILLRYLDSWNLPQARYFHLVQKRGQEGRPLITLTMPPGDRRLVKVEFLYPPDATPPQVLTVETLD
ncbi:MAG: DUF3370 domain-containing protein [Cyanobacteria bacterium P01_F01_bin.150]